MQLICNFAFKNPTQCYNKAHTEEPMKGTLSVLLYKQDITSRYGDIFATVQEDLYSFCYQRDVNQYISWKLNQGISICSHGLGMYVQTLAISKIKIIQKQLCFKNTCEEGSSEFGS